MNKKDKAIELITDKKNEINNLVGKGYMSKREGNKVIRMCNKLEKEIEDPDFNFFTILTQYGELLISHRFLYDPANSEAVLEMAKDLNIK